MGKQHQLAPPAPSGNPQQRDAIEIAIAALAKPVVDRLSQAASRLQTLTQGELAALEAAAQLLLDERLTTLRTLYAGLTERAAAARAVADLIDLPQAMRASVRKDRGAQAQGAAS